MALMLFLQTFRIYFFAALLSSLLVLSLVQAQPEAQAISDYDVIVVGSEPEGIIAAVAASESGAKTLLISEDKKLGGLFVLGQMNSLDLRTDPFNFQQGLFLRWWEQVGKGHSFDVIQAEKAFTNMLTQAGVEVRTNSPALLPVVETNILKGVIVTSMPQNETLFGKQIIDATAEMEFSSKAGARASFGFSSIGFNARMADTLVFRIDGINWTKLSKGIKAKGKNYASVDEHVAWGHFDGYPAAYVASQEGLRLRGLNLGRQDDGSVLVNALLIYGINPFDKISIAEAKAKASYEAPLIIEYLKQALPGFENAHFGGVADELYIRETRHLEAECTLTTDNVLDNLVTPFDIAAGGYPLDVQTLTPYDNGYVYGTPDIYGVQLCVSVPKGLSNLWVVGKSAGFDPIAASSARVVPFGMSIAEAVGIAAAISAWTQQSSQTFIANNQNILTLRETLLARGAYLPEAKPRKPVGPFDDPNYAAYRLMLSRGLAVGGYSNDPDLDKPMSALSYVYLLSNVGQRFFSNPDFGKMIVSRYPNPELSLTGDVALNITYDAACLLGICSEKSWQALNKAGFSQQSFMPEQILTRGDMYSLASSLTHYGTRILTDNGQPNKP